MNEYLDANRKLWNGWTPIHARSSFYDVDAFRKGKTSLNEIELEQVGDVDGKRLLHLQCHFGLDTLSWARLGADATGVDFSERAIALAKQLSTETGVEARFLCGDIYDLADLVEGRFDVVFTSYGVLPWLPDLDRWARLVASVLERGGVFHLVEFHPLASMLGEDGRTFRYRYFHEPEPDRADNVGSYADPAADFRHDSYEWSHSLGDVVEALLGAGLTIRSFREHPCSPYNCFPFLEEREPGRWFARIDGTDLPLLFSISAGAPGA
jgi:SAM-dependent methyltransferase